MKHQQVDAIATKRFDAQTGADREVQRILIELLTQMDGFDQASNVKVIMATNRADTLDPALLRPGRLDRKIEFPNPSRREKRLIFQTITSKMSIGADVDLEDCTSLVSSMSRLGLQRGLRAWRVVARVRISILTMLLSSHVQTFNGQKKSPRPRSPLSAKPPVCKLSARTGSSSTLSSPSC